MLNVLKVNKKNCHFCHICNICNICHFFNECVDKGTFPSALKHANLHLSLKKDTGVLKKTTDR